MQCQYRLLPPRPNINSSSGYIYISANFVYSNTDDWWLNTHKVTNDYYLNFMPTSKDDTMTK